VAIAICWVSATADRSSNSAISFRQVRFRVECPGGARRIRHASWRFGRDATGIHVPQFRPPQPIPPTSGSGMTGSSTTDLPSGIIIGSSITGSPSSAPDSRSTTSASWSGASGHLGAGIGAGSGFATNLSRKFGRSQRNGWRSRLWEPARSHEAGLTGHPSGKPFRTRAGHNTGMPCCPGIRPGPLQDV
jgi:hypothetical protein